MALVLKDRVKETSATTGTGTLTLAGASTGFQSFAVIGNGNTTYYTITDGTDWEVGIGTYTSSGTTLSRDTVLSSSNSGSAVDWGAGSKDVFVTVPASDVTASKSIGVDQTWQDMTASRSAAVTYTNTTGRSIYVAIYFYRAAGALRDITVDGFYMRAGTTATQNGIILTCIIPDGSTYECSTVDNLVGWYELR